MVSHQSFTIMAKDTIGLKGGSILFQAPKEISLVKCAASPTVINMCNGFDTIGASDQVLMDGDRSGYYLPGYYDFSNTDGIRRSDASDTAL